MNFEQYPLPWTAVKHDNNIWKVLDNDGWVIATGLPSNIARLIAGAPDVLEAAIEVNRVLSGKQIVINSGEIDVPSACQKIRTAIDKSLESVE